MAIIRIKQKNKLILKEFTGKDLVNNEGWKYGAFLKDRANPKIDSAEMMFDTLACAEEFMNDYTEEA